MKFSIIDQYIQENSWNVSDLIYFDEIRQNKSNPNYPAFIVRWKYIKTITQIPWVDFFNLTPSQQEDKLKYFSAFLANLKSQVQIYIHSKKIDTEKYLKETSNLVEKSPYINENLKKEILRGLPLTLTHLKNDSSSNPYKKEYYIVTSSKIEFNWDSIQDDHQNTIAPKDYDTWEYIGFSPNAWTVFEWNFNRYYQEILWPIVQMIDKNLKIKPLNTEEKIIWLFAEINNDIDRNSIPKIKEIL